VLTIDDLPDDDLLAIFDFYVFKYQDLDYHKSDYYDDYHNHPKPDDYGTKRKIESWQSLVHVCRRWRCLVFGSPRRLNLRLCCYAPRISTRKSLDVWPALPLVISGGVYEESVDNVVAVLEHSDRICQIALDSCATSLRSEKVWKAMRVPFPGLAALYLSFDSWMYRPILPDSFLGGSAPRLQFLTLFTVSFPGLPKLLLSTTHLVHLHLHCIPPAGYISPEAMATCLSMLTSLETLRLLFGSSYPKPDLKNRRPFPPTRSVLLTLTKFWFKGLNEYLQEFVARIDAPRLSSTMFFGNIDFGTPELNQFISRTPTLGAYDVARLIFQGYSALVMLRQSHPEPSDHRMFDLLILGEMSKRQLSTVAKICTLSLHLLSTMENLYIDGDVHPVHFCRDGIENTEWLNLLLPFTAVKNLYLSRPFLSRIARALQELTERRTTEVLPALQNVLLEGFQPSEPVQEGFARFISTRQLTNRPVAISVWDRDLVEDKS
jgi:hypothetical protein